MKPIHSIHILGSREFGGADQFYVRLLRALKEAGQPVTAINRPRSPVAEALQSDPIEQIHLPLANRWDAYSWWRIRQEVARTGPCIVQTYMGRATRLTRLPKDSRAAHVARLGGFYKLDGYYRHADAWVGNTRAICDFLVKGGMPVHKVFHIGNFVPAPVTLTEEKKMELRRRFEITPDAWILFALGRLVSKKGFSDLIRALSLLPQEISGREVVLLIAGDGPELSKLESLAREVDQTHRLRLLGWQNPPDQFYQLADGFVCPSRHEPLGNVILEAWNHLLPVISTSNEGATELIEDGVNGLLCGMRSPEKMAATIAQLLESSETARRSLATQGNQSLNTRYGKEAITVQYQTLYSSLIQS